MSELTGNRYVVEIRVTATKRASRRCDFDDEIDWLTWSMIGELKEMGAGGGRSGCCWGKVGVRRVKFLEERQKDESPCLGINKVTVTAVCDLSVLTLLQGE